MHSLNNSHRAARPASIFICALLCISGVTRAVAGDLFTINAVTTDGGPSLNQTVGSSSVLDLVQNAVDAQNSFAPFAGRGYSASLQYAGVANAMSFNIKSAGTSATLQIPSTGFSKTFTGTSRDDVNSQITAFLKTDGESEYAKFLKAMDEQSTVAVSDGNPNSSTAMMASETFPITRSGKARRARKKLPAARMPFAPVLALWLTSGDFTSRESAAPAIPCRFR